MKFKNVVFRFAAIATLLAASTHAQNRMSLPHEDNGINSQGAKKTELANKAISAQTNCVYSFSTGSGYGYLNFCVTANGTFANFESPQTIEMLNQGESFEGYGLCDDSGAGTQYWDYGDGGFSGWDAPTTLSSTSSSVKIRRTTFDGAWTLTNTISMVAGPPPYAKVVMQLKNNSSSGKGLYLLRFAGFVPDNAASTGNYNENYDASNNSVWGYNSFADEYLNGSDGYGLMLQNVGTPSPLTNAWQGFTQSTGLGPYPCTLFSSPGGTIVYGTGSGFIWYNAVLDGKQTFTVTDKYFSF